MDQRSEKRAENMDDSLGDEDDVIVLTDADVRRMRKRKDVEGLINALRYKWKTTVRFHAARALGELGDLRAVEPLIQALKTEGWVVRESAIWALGELGDLRAVEPLIEALNDENRGLRIDAARALGNLGDVRAIEPLRELLEDNYDITVQEALWDLENIKRDRENQL